MSYGESDPPPQNGDAREQRKWKREPPPKRPTHVWLSLKKRIEVQVLDESEGGIAVLLSGDESPEVGFQVRVETRNGRRTAQITYVDNQPEADELRVGLSWVD